MVIFVYGTLRRGQSNHAELGHARFLREVATAPRYELVDLGEYPALLEGGSTAVQGELYEIDEELLAHLDEFEGVPALYQRKSIALQDVQSARAEGYVMRRRSAGRAPRLRHGDWTAHDSAS
jgi:gamma-glutamylcyclotransferase (GGCT)/AIG2-like uncharacterized protein YtfP